MHEACWTFVARAARDITARRLRIVEVGSKDVNGSVRPIFEGHDYTGVDIAPGKGVDVVGDGATWGETAAYDVGICCEVFEHAMHWWDIIANLRRIVRPGGMLLLTCAGPGRPPHSGMDGGPLTDGEWYQNITPHELANELDGCRYINVEAEAGDVRAIAVVG